MRNLLVIHEFLKNLPFIIVHFLDYHIYVLLDVLDLLLKTDLLGTPARDLLHNIRSAMPQNSCIIAHTIYDRDVIIMINGSIHLISFFAFAEIKLIKIV